jgi:acyl-CoA reductase-like NAD-dependent aldehyde dehydrogenase
MAKWIIVNPITGEQVVCQPEDETLEFDDGQQAAAAAAAFLIDFPDKVLRLSEEERAAFRQAIDDLLPMDEEEYAETDEEPEPALTELHVVCLEHGVRIRMRRESIEPQT